MNVLITGGLGYIGSHIVLALIESKAVDKIVIFDDESNCDVETVFKQLLNAANINNQKMEYLNVSINQLDVMEDTFEMNYGVGYFDVLIHTAALKSVSEGEANPDKYNYVNVDGTKNIIHLCEKYKIKQLQFSSSAAVYEYHNGDSLNEHSPSDKPPTVYGRTKKECENLIRQSKIENYIIFRYFNVIGVDKRLGSHKSHDNIIPNIIKAYQNNEIFKVYGSDYNTFDGTAERDYIDIRSVAFNHVTAFFSELSYVVYNISSNTSTSIFELLSYIDDHCGHLLREVVEPRKGDVPFIVGVNYRARRSHFDNPHTLSDSLYDECANAKILTPYLLEKLNNKS